MIERNVSAKAARSVLLEEYNDIDIYVEDTAEGYRKIYKELLNKVFDGTLRIEHILPLGDRNQVITECQKNQEPNGRKRLYIIDGDLYLINNTPAPKLNGLFVLQKYCIENYLIEKEAIVEVYYEESAILEKEQIESNLDFETWISQNDELLSSLFIVYALCNRHSISGTVSYKVSNLFSEDAGTICRTKTEARITELSQILIDKIGEARFLAEKKEVEDRIATEKNKCLKYVSGKDYLMPLLKSKLKSFISTSTSKVNINLRLAMRCKVDELIAIKDYVFQ